MTKQLVLTVAILMTLIGYLFFTIRPVVVVDIVEVVVGLAGPVVGIAVESFGFEPVVGIEPAAAFVAEPFGLQALPCLESSD